MNSLRSPSMTWVCVLAFGFTASMGGCAARTFAKAGAGEQELRNDAYDCEVEWNRSGPGIAYAQDPLGNLGYLAMAGSDQQRCMERKGWTRTDGEAQAKKPDVVTGPNPRTEQNQPRGQETPLASSREKEGQIYERQIEGDKLFAKSSEKQKQDKDQGEKQKAILDAIYEDIMQRGHVIVVGEPEVEAREGVADLSFPVVINSDPAIRSKIDDLNRNRFGKDLSDGTYRSFEKRLDNLYFDLELVLAGAESLVCHAPRNLTKYETDGEFLSVDDKPSAWNIRISAPLQATKRITSVRGGFVEGAHGALCGVTRNNK